MEKRIRCGYPRSTGPANPDRSWMKRKAKKKDTRFNRKGQREGREGILGESQREGGGKYWVKPENTHLPLISVSEGPDYVVENIEVVEKGEGAAHQNRS